MVALATLALQSAKKLFQKGYLKTKHEALNLFGFDARVLVLIPHSESDLTKIQHRNDPHL